MNGFREEIKGIFRLNIPFEDVYTSVFLIEHKQGNVLVDCATTKDDVEGCIIPALGELGYEPADISALVITHPHEDHAGGLEHFLGHAPSAKVVADVRKIFDGLMTYPLPGHTDDMLGVFDARTGTLISGDGLQGAGVGKFRCNVPNVHAYLDTLRNIEADGRIENILFSHSFEPWNEYGVFGRQNVIMCTRDCREIIKTKEKK